MTEEYNCCLKTITEMIRFYRTFLVISVAMLLILCSYSYYVLQIEEITPNFQGRNSGSLEDRKKHLLWACQSLREKNMTDLQEPVHFLEKNKRWAISDRYKLLNCKIRKVGSTNIARVLYTLDHLAEDTDSNKVSKGRARFSVLLENGKRNKAVLESDLEAYTKFIFVRDPLERLVSAYRDKRPRSWFRKKGISLKKFFEKVVQNPSEKDDTHSVSYAKYCKPCSVKYDLIGLLDTYEDDMRSILRTVGVEEAVILPARNQTGYSQQKTNDDVIKTYLKKIPKSLIKKIYEKYYLDYYLFGFTKPDF